MIIPLDFERQSSGSFGFISRISCFEFFGQGFNWREGWPPFLELVFLALNCTLAEICANSAVSWKSLLFPPFWTCYLFFSWFNASVRLKASLGAHHVKFIGGIWIAVVFGIYTIFAFQLPYNFWFFNFKKASSQIIPTTKHGSKITDIQVLWRLECSSNFNMVHCTCGVYFLEIIPPLLIGIFLRMHMFGLESSIRENT